MIGKLLLVDDQSIFRQGLTKMIGEHALGWTVVGEAENGEEAIEQIRRLTPDLILTDIRMPLMDGLQLAEYVHTHHRHIAIIILTGYEDFKYAQAALKYGALDFLLKPCNEQTLLEVLQRAYDHFREQRLRAEREEADHRAMEEHVLRSLLLELPCDDRLVERIRERYAGRELWILRVEQYFPAGKAYRSGDISLLQFALFNMISELAERPPSHGRLVSLQYDRFALFVDGEDAAACARLEEQIASTALSYLGLHVRLSRCGTAGHPRQWPALLSSHEPAGAAPDARTAAVDSAAPPRLPAANVTRIKEMQTELATRIMLGQIGEVRRETDSILGRLASLPPEEARMETLSLVMALDRTASQLFSDGEVRTDMAGQIEAIPPDTGTGGIVTFAREQTEQFLQRFHEWQADKNKNIITKTMEYVDSHYMETCTLTEVAEKLHMSGTYFSKLFKRETGDTFTSYVTKVRMNKAKLLLSNTELKVFEIASAVGYDDPNYFTNVFKTTQNVSPTEFRKLRRGS